jgi:hypothetical protein
MFHTGELSVSSSYPVCSGTTSFGFCETLEKGCPEFLVGRLFRILFRQLSRKAPLGQPAQIQKGHPSMGLLRCAEACRQHLRRYSTVVPAE